MIAPFAISRLPRIEFGSGAFRKLPGLAAGFGHRFLVVLGNRSFRDSPHWGWFITQMGTIGASLSFVMVPGEPGPDLVDEAVSEYGDMDVDAVIGIGGGSVLDAAKAIAGLLKTCGSVLDHLEGVGPEKPYTGPATPFIAVPTTAGTGSEATKNAVLSRHGLNGFKKSFRNEKLMAEYAIVDPDLLTSCPPELIAGNGMDAFTQLLESYVSVRANPITDALALAGMKAAMEGLLPWYENGADGAEGREKMALASLLSGICLAQAGLGSVHGLAQPLGSLFPCPHGVVCGTLVAAATEVNIEVMLERDRGNPALAKYAEVGRLFTGDADSDAEKARTRLIERLQAWTETMRLPDLTTLGIRRQDFTRIVAHCRGSSMKTNPVALTDGEVERILELRLG